MSIAVILAIFAAVFIGTGDFFGGILGRRDPSYATLILMYGVVFVLALPIALIVDGLPQQAGVGWGIGMGVMWPIGIYALVRGVAFGRVVVVIPIAGVLSAAIPVAVDLIGGNQPGSLVASGVLLGVIAVGLTGIGHDERGGRSVAWSATQGAIGGVTTGISLVLMDQAAESGLWPLVVAALTAVVLMVAAYRIRGRSIAPIRQAVAPAVAMGILIAGSFVAMMFAFPRGSLTVVAVVVSQYPAATIILTSLIWRERPRGLQYIGVALALVAVALIAAG